MLHSSFFHIEKTEYMHVYSSIDLLAGKNTKGKVFYHPSSTLKDRIYINQILPRLSLMISMYLYLTLTFTCYNEHSKTLCKFFSLNVIRPSPLYF